MRRLPLLLLPLALLVACHERDERTAVAGRIDHHPMTWEAVAGRYANVASGGNGNLWCFLTNEPPRDETAAGVVTLSNREGTVDALGVELATPEGRTFTAAMDFAPDGECLYHDRVADVGAHILGYRVEERRRIYRTPGGDLVTTRNGEQVRYVAFVPSRTEVHDLAEHARVRP